MRFSLVQVYKERDGFVDGVWVQDHSGTIDTAVQAARVAEKANGGRIKVAVVEQIGGSSPRHDLLSGLKRLG